MDRDFYGIFWIKPPGLANNKIVQVANAIDDVGTNSSPRPEENATLKPEFKTIYDEDGKIVAIASKWIKAGKVSAAQKQVAYYYGVCSIALDMPIEAMSAIVGYEETDKQGAKDEMP